jgi:hypothetical protein
MNEKTIILYTYNDPLPTVIRYPVPGFEWVLV